MGDTTEEQRTGIVIENDQLLDVLAGLYRRALERDRADGVTHDESALGAVGMALEAIGYDSLPHNLMMLVCLAARRIAQSEVRYG